MNEYLKTALSWLASYNVPVILLSATLPKTVKHDLIKAYLTGKSAVNSSARTTTSFTTTTSFSDTVTDVATNILDTQNEYPVLTYSEGNYVKNFPLTLSARSVEVKVELLPDEEIINLLQAKLSSGGVAGLIFDTVKRAQDFFQQIENAFADEIAANTIRTELFHSRFISLDRLAKEAELVRALGPPLDFSENPRPKKMIAVGTQVLEQSLDIDFDILITDIAPIDLLLQRMGRLHRHNRDARPALLQSPECYITGVVDFESFKFVPGIEIIYGKLFLIRTLEILPDQIFLPDQINPLVQKVYDLSKYDSGDNEVQVNRQALDQHYERERSKKVRSKPFRIPESRRMEDLISVNISASDIKPESGMSQAVRDTNESLEVYLICRKHNGYYLLPWVQNHKIAKGANIPVDNIIPNSLARLISQCSVSLPRELSSGWAIDSVICQLEQNMIDSGLLENWQESSWLAGDLALFLDNNLENEMIVNDKHYKIRYMECLGLQIETSNERSNE
jgi:CRISPR-associated helicase Cas3